MRPVCCLLLITTNTGSMKPAFDWSLDIDIRPLSSIAYHHKHRLHVCILGYIFYLLSSNRLFVRRDLSCSTSRICFLFIAGDIEFFFRKTICFRFYVATSWNHGHETLLEFKCYALWLLKISGSIFLAIWIQVSINA